MAVRPKIRIALTTTDMVFEIAGWTSMLALWVLTLISYPRLPETIPTHFNLAGQADDFGNKAMILSLPVVASVLFVSLTILNKFPHLFNYPTAINHENALTQYTNMTRMIRYLKLILVVVFGLIVYITIQNAYGQSKGPGVLFLPLILGLIFTPLLYFAIKSFRAK